MDPWIREDKQRSTGTTEEKLMTYRIDSSSVLPSATGEVGSQLSQRLGAARSKRMFAAVHLCSSSDG